MAALFRRDVDLTYHREQSHRPHVTECPDRLKALDPFSPDKDTLYEVVSKRLIVY